MIYSEAAYFDGNHCAHVAAWQEAKRLARIRKQGAAMLERRTGGRAIYARR